MAVQLHPESVAERIAQNLCKDICNTILFEMDAGILVHTPEGETIGIIGEHKSNLIYGDAATRGLKRNKMTCGPTMMYVWSWSLAITCCVVIDMATYH